MGHILIFLEKNSLFKEYLSLANGQFMQEKKLGLLWLHIDFDPHLSHSAVYF